MNASRASSMNGCRIMAIAALFFLATPLPTRADDAPTSVNDLSNVVQITNFSVSRTGSDWTSCASFKNIGSRPVRAIELTLRYYDAFDTEIAQFRADRVGSFAPGVLIEPGSSNVDSLTPGDNCWEVPIAPGSIDRVTVTVVKLRYIDGEIVALSADAKPTLFTGHLLESLEGHPARIKCWFGMTYDWDFAQTVPACGGAIKKWKAAHQAQQSDYSPSPQPTG